MPDTGWIQPDVVHTREKHALVAGVNSNISHRHGTIADLHTGPIEYDPDYLNEVYLPALDTTMSADGASPEADQRASFVNNERWLTTPIARLPDPEEYDALLHITGSAAHVHDFDPHRTWLAAAEAAILAAFDADPPPGVTFRFVEWETNPFQPESWPWGTSTNRRIEVDLSLLENARFDRAGDPDTPAPSTVLDHGLAGVPVSLDPGGTHLYFWDATLEAWEGVEQFGYSWNDVAADMLLLGGPFNTGTSGFDISDATWEANAWDVARGIGYATKGLPLILGPAFAFVPDFDPGSYPDPLGFEEHVRLTTTADIFFESDWTPPRYRIVHNGIVTAPRLRHHPARQSPRRGGWGGVVRHYPPSPNLRGHGGAREP